MGIVFPYETGVWDTRQGEGELEDCLRWKLLGWKMWSVDRYLGVVGGTVKVVVL